MSFNFSPRIVTDKLVFCLDAANKNSYPGGGTAWNPVVNKYDYDVSLINGPTFSNENLGTIVFDGTDDYAQTHKTYADKITTKMTFDVWFNRSQDVNAFNMVFNMPVPYIAFRGASAGPGNENRFLFSFVTRLSGSDTQRYLYSPGTYLDNVWYNVACTLDIDTTLGTCDSKMYVNGEFINSFTLPPGSLDTQTPYPSPNLRMRIGYYTDAYAPIPFKGKISTVKIYEKILSPSEIKQNYDALKNRYI